MSDDISPTQIRRQRFEMVRRGFDPQEVGAFLERVADRLAFAERAVTEAETRLSSTSTELDDARAAEEALQLTMVAATQAKDEMLARANAQAEEVRAAAQREAEAVIAEARRSAAALVDDTRRDTGGVVSSARAEHSDLLEQVEQLRTVVAHVRHMLASVAGTVDPALDEAERILANPAAEVPGTAPVTAPAIPESMIRFEAEEAPGSLADAVEDEREEELEVIHEVALESVPEVEEEPEQAPVMDPAAEDEEPQRPPVLEVVSSAEEAEEAPDVPVDEVQDDDDEDAGDDAAEVERLLRQLRGG